MARPTNSEIKNYRFEYRKIYGEDFNGSDDKIRELYHSVPTSIPDEENRWIIEQMMADMECKPKLLSGDRAYELFTSLAPFPLHDYLEDWKTGKIDVAVGYIIAVVSAYQRMVSTHEGKRDGTYRPKIKQF